MPELNADPTLVTSTALPSTATVVTIVTSAAVGADYVLKQMFAFSWFEGTVIVFAAILSFFATFVATKIPLMWRMLLWPVNFAVLVYLVISSSFFIDAAKKEQADAGPPGSTFVVNQERLPSTKR
jgi:hypothetical protein